MIHNVLFLAFALLTLIHTSPFYAAPVHSEELIRVPLKTSAKTFPLYMAPILLEEESNQEEKEYLSQILSVYKKDLDLSGYYQILPHDTERKALAHKTLSPDEPKAEYSKQWQKLCVRYLLHICVHRQGPSEAKWQVKAYDSAQNQWLYLPPCVLSGNLDQDRRKIHRNIDQLNARLVGAKAFVSCRILFTLDASEPQTNQTITEIWESDIDGGNALCLNRINSLAVSPSYVPPEPSQDPSQYLYVSYLSGQPKIMIASLQGGHGRRMSLLGGNQLAPQINAQRNMMAFICDAEGNPDLWIQEIDLKKVKARAPYKYFADANGVQATPVWSPLGNELALVSSKDGRPRIYLFSPPTEGQNQAIRFNPAQAKLVSRKNLENTCPSWSPDGKKIVYCVKNFGQRQICVLDLETGREEILTDGPGNKENPTWAPDNHHIIFNMEFGQRSELYVLDLNTRRPKRLTNLGQDARFPSCRLSGIDE